jgi:hypothetical protein
MRKELFSNHLSGKGQTVNVSRVFPTASPVVCPIAVYRGLVVFVKKAVGL